MDNEAIRDANKSQGDHESKNSTYDDEQLIDGGISTGKLDNWLKPIKLLPLDFIVSKGSLPIYIETVNWPLPKRNWDLFTDGSSILENGHQKAGEVVVTAEQKTESAVLPSGASAQRTEQTALTGALQLSSGMNLCRLYLPKFKDTDRSHHLS
ncbi:Calmin [Manis pentadactyla]|nr:Calmin [Manis pentadactyla]